MLNRVFKSLMFAAIAVTPFKTLAMDNPVHLTVLDGWREADGTHVAAIKLELDDGWKTYWRAPGEGGIPPFFDFVGSSNLTDFNVIWPAPVVFYQSGLWSIGYKDSVLLPIQVESRYKSRDIQLSGVVDIGVCKEVCLPISLKIDATLDADATKKNPSIRAAMASVPYTQTEAGVDRAVCKITPNEYGLTIRTLVDMPLAGEDEFVVLESADPNHWLSESVSARNGEQLISESTLMSLDGGAVVVNRADIRITVLGDDYAVDIKGCTGS